MRNKEVAQLLENIAAALELKGESPFRIRAYQEASRSIGFMTEAIEDLWTRNSLDTLVGVGPSIAAKISDYLQTGRSAYLEEIRQGLPVAVLEFTRLPGLGPKRAKALYEALGCDSFEKLAERCREHKVRQIRGMGEKTESNLLKEIARLTERTARIPLGIAWPLADRLASGLRKAHGLQAAEPAGSIRRRQETIGDIDILVAAGHEADVRAAISALPEAKEILASGPTKITFLTASNFQVDVRVVLPEVWGAALQYFTGSKSHNIALRERAIQRGYKLSEYGLEDRDTGKLVAARTELEVYAALGLPWIPPELRENAGELEAAASGHLPRLIALEDIRGDCHCHTRYSDGEATVEAMVQAAIARGYDYLVITDHSPGLGVAQGLSPEKIAKQRAEIASLAARVAPFMVLQGIELEIRANGDLDLPDEVLAGFEVVTASLHSATAQDSARITARLLAALAHPQVKILNHPTGRLIGVRPAYEVNLDAVLRQAALLGKPLEINGSYLRLDLGDMAARHAKDLGASFTLGSDAHSVAGLDAMRLAVAIARRAWLEPGDVLNTQRYEVFAERLHLRSLELRGVR
ncbi:MAG: DNA polymerase/3'-5' exonuclease PolX [Cyanobacteria bacterium REEB65]|nr:DNA polymerase/3'-5' exonuclease PolX [Cyanobacteria bacterium REEB65]